ncbi:hypothetical protein Tco_1006871 [Tanacetum coccineum]|uniref:Uncharacterized protein n=1 Tax=Tanacetum coccineum TaxID=301880 RepID=A0ABQ5FK19_9ASTR
MSMWIISRGVVLLILLMEYKVLRDSLLHRSSINNSASLSNKFGGFYFSFKFGITGLLHHVITTIAERIRADQASVFMAMTFEQRSSSLILYQMMIEQRSSSLVLHQMMSDHNSSDLAPQRQEMSVENVSSGLVPQG